MNPRKASRSAVAVAALLLSASANAQLFRAYLESTGSDANPCTLPAPCRLLPAALAAVADGGEIWMLDSANYNTAPVAITKSVTILAVPGALGSVLAIGGDAIDIATAGVKVVLRNLVIVPQPGGGGTNGINMTNGAGLTVENCLVANLPQNGIVVDTAASVQITDTTIRDNSLSGLSLMNGSKATVTHATISENAFYGVVVLGSASGATVSADIADTTLDGNDSGLYAVSPNANAVVKVSVRASRIVRSPSYGLAAQSNSGAAVTLSASNNIISNNLNGIAAYFPNTYVWLSGNTVSDNGMGILNGHDIANNFAVVESAANNAVRNNQAGNTSGPITVIATK